MPSKEAFPIKPCNIETIDTGFVEHIDQSFNIHVYTNSGFRKVPVIWVGAERAHQIKNDSSLRDSSGKLILPIITIQRTGLAKDPSFKGKIQADIRPQKGPEREHIGGAFSVVSKLNQAKTTERQVARNAKSFGFSNKFYNQLSREIVLDEYLIPVPTYVAITYSITLRCEYQQQMNQMVMPFITRTGQVNHFVFVKDNHRFESFIQQDFAASNNLNNMAEQERKFETKVDIKVLGYLIGEGVNEPRPKIVKRESVVKFFTPIETLVPPGITPSDVVSATPADYEYADSSHPSNPDNVIVPGTVVPESSTGGGDSPPVCIVRRRLARIFQEDAAATSNKLESSRDPFASTVKKSITEIIDGVRRGDETIFNEREIVLESDEEISVSKTDIDTLCDDD